MPTRTGSSWGAQHHPGRCGRAAHGCRAYIVRSCDRDAVVLRAAHSGNARARWVWALTRRAGLLRGRARHQRHQRQQAQRPGAGAQHSTVSGGACDLLADECLCSPTSTVLLWELMTAHCSRTDDHQAAVRPVEEREPVCWRARLLGAAAAFFRRTGNEPQSALVSTNRENCVAGARKP